MGHKELWWWNEIVQDKIRDKQGSFRELMRCTNEEERLGLRESYKNAKREVKKAVSEAKNNAYKRIYECLETKGGEHYMFKIAKARELIKKDLGTVKFINGADGHVLVKEQDIRLRWKTYFQNLFNNERAYQQESDNTHLRQQQRNNCYCRHIT
ncbi:uncharacterized protein LOC143599578 [Bidens hawaiensis]|uniref:uncharacterized protein LOC143599578 n=1 Tax=Bidens hawaiensis TaxID=980011 RepID=UPI00404A62EC